MSICPICHRELAGEVQEHHLKPRTFRSRDRTVLDRDNLVSIHRICHEKIHATFSEQQLFQHYHTIERICSHPEIEKFVKWVQKKSPDFYEKNKDTKERKRKRKRK